jgi:multidrug efflux pump subunit AcrA (membrane-fusion protein)
MKLSEKLKKFFFIPPLILGVVVFVSFIKSKKPPEQSDIQERSTVVRVIPAPEVAVVPRAVGYGTVEPGETWEAVAEVEGKIIDMHRELKKGAIFKKDDVLLRIDPAEYGLAKIRAQAEVENIKAQLRELRQEKANILESLEIEKNALELNRKELERKRELMEKGFISLSELDQEEQLYLDQKNRVQDLQSSLNLIPSKQKALEANLTKELSLNNLPICLISIG